MFFKILLMPFTWFLDGLTVILNVLLVKPFRLFVDGLEVIVRLVFKLLKIVFVSFYRIIKGVILYGAIGIKEIFKILFSIIKSLINIVVSIIVFVFKLLKTIFIFVFKGQKEVIVITLQIITMIIKAFIQFGKWLFKPIIQAKIKHREKIEAIEAKKRIPMVITPLLPMEISCENELVSDEVSTLPATLLQQSNISQIEDKGEGALPDTTTVLGNVTPSTKSETISVNQKKMTRKPNLLLKLLGKISGYVSTVFRFFFKGLYWSMATIISALFGVLKYYYKGLCSSLLFIPNLIKHRDEAKIKSIQRKSGREEIKKQKERLRVEKFEKIKKKRQERKLEIERKNEVKQKIRQVSKGPVQNILDTIRYAPERIKVGIQKWHNNLPFVRSERSQLELKREQLMIDFEGSNEIRSNKKNVFKYIAKNTNGKIEKGRLSAYSKLDVHSYLLAENYEVYEIEPVKSSSASGPKRKMKTSDMVFFLTQLSTYIRAGIPLVDAIKILGKQSKTPKIVDLYKDIVYDLTMGDSFSQTLDNQGETFPRLLVNMIKASELAGSLTETLDDMADYYSAVSKTKKQMISAMTYPIAISSFAILVVVFVLVFVIPNFVSMYREMDAKLPTITVVTIAVSDFLVKNYLFILVGLVLFIVGIRALFMNVKAFKTIVQSILMRIPVFGKIFIYNEVTMFSKTFSSLWKHNVFITDSMEVLGKITNNEIYRSLIISAITNVAKGEPISTAFKDQWAFPIVAYEMLVTGERTGQPGEMMAKVADFYQEEHKNAVNSIKTFIEPIMIIFLAVIVGTILLSVILPMFTLYGNMAG